MKTSRRKKNSLLSWFHAPTQPVGPCFIFLSISFHLFAKSICLQDKWLLWQAR
jgi:hypothetical protein